MREVRNFPSTNSMLPMTIWMTVIVILVTISSTTAIHFGTMKSSAATAANAIASSRRLPFRRPSTSKSSSFVITIPRGGGWFGGGNGNNNNKKDKSQGKKKYKALSRSEIEEKLNIPVWGIVSSNGQGIAIGQFTNPEGAPGVAPGERSGDMAYFFFSKQMAQQALMNMQSNNPHIDLQLTSLSLGKIWFKLLHNPNSDYLDCRPLVGGDDNSDDDLKNNQQKIHKKKVTFRLVAGARDFFLARLLTSLSPKEAEKLRLAVQDADRDQAREIVMKATQKKSSPSTKSQEQQQQQQAFVSPYNQIPLFMMPQLRVRLKDGEFNNGSSGDQPTTLGDVDGSSNNNDAAGDGGTTASKLPVFFSSKDMVKSYLGTQNIDVDFNNGMSVTDFTAAAAAANSQLPQQPPNQQPVIQLIELHELVRLMQEDSDFDFRSMVLFTSSEDDDLGGSNKNDEDEDSDDGGGGDFGISATGNDGGDDEIHIEMYENFECTPFAMMEEDGGYSNLMPM